MRLTVAQSTGYVTGAYQPHAPSQPLHHQPHGYWPYTPYAPVSCPSYPLPQAPVSYQPPFPQQQPRSLIPASASLSSAGSFEPDTASAASVYLTTASVSSARSLGPDTTSVAAISATSADASSDTDYSDDIPDTSTVPPMPRTAGRAPPPTSTEPVTFQRRPELHYRNARSLSSEPPAAIASTTPAPNETHTPEPAPQSNLDPLPGEPTRFNHRQLYEARIAPSQSRRGRTTAAPRANQRD
ncbi:hypothetical protein BU26DRAFT_576179 [Trematosphaeria pertusa]|uniref:Uncharacterized protein n=1 Tax=Trematosphaeria pertusa TaxID=390896 RepID=A0A6A6I804_9PLEO|nr:uncharacterized protein BU26DRAFT_576179 [Trematosphaeria pertusa]KAF2246417.1 hypothetical protein BU26DRAFT_576179 [Trematosphaeria pertusa]